MLFWRAQPLIPQALFPSCITYEGKTDVVPAAQNIGTAGLPSFKEKTLAEQSLQDFFFSLQVIHLTFVQVNSTHRLLPSSAWSCKVLNHLRLWWLEEFRWLQSLKATLTYLERQGRLYLTAEHEPTEKHPHYICHLYFQLSSFFSLRVSVSWEQATSTVQQRFPKDKAAHWQNRDYTYICFTGYDFPLD